MSEPEVAHRPEVPIQPHAGIVRTILGRDDEDDDRPLPDLPPLTGATSSQERFGR